MEAKSLSSFQNIGFTDSLMLFFFFFYAMQLGVEKEHVLLIQSTKTKICKFFCHYYLTEILVSSFMLC